jgi:hypothetical protein
MLGLLIIVKCDNIQLIFIMTNFLIMRISVYIYMYVYLCVLDVRKQKSKLCISLVAGYTGNGFYCSDIDECQVNNGGCSVSPLVQCINTQVQ